MVQETFNGFSVSELLTLWSDLQSPEGAPAGVSKEKMKALNEYLMQQKYEDSVFATSHPLKQPLCLKK